MPDEHNRLVFPPKARWIANPGSVGQPRDGDPRASYGFYDDERGIFEVHRVAYPLEDTQRKLREAGLPEPLAARLTVGR
jgi:diadenosine tetraphosphatase ApaH/serine/threonine PP2A family protein phosphatase